MSHNRSFRLSAFTITELLIVMLITSILVVIMGGVLLNLTQYRSLLNRKSQPVKNLARLHFLIDRDQQRATEIRFEKDSLVFHMDKERIKYILGENTLYRQQLSLVDSFPFKASLSNLLSEEGLVTTAKLTLLSGGTENQTVHEILIAKEYSSTQFFKLAEDER